MARNFKELEAKMRPEVRGRAKAGAKEMLAEVRQAAGLTQEQLAAALGIKQPSLSRLESQHDMQVSTLARLVKALGGELELIAHLPGGTIRIRQFEDGGVRETLKDYIILQYFVTVLRFAAQARFLLPTGRVRSIAVVVAHPLTQFSLPE
jgi:transcriptional regulator with XRE-family HTH domain